MSSSAPKKGQRKKNISRDSSQIAANQNLGREEKVEFLYLHRRELGKWSMASSKLNSSNTKTPNICLIVISCLFHYFRSHPTRLIDIKEINMSFVLKKKKFPQTTFGRHAPRLRNKLSLFVFLMSVIYTLTHPKMAEGRTRVTHRADKSLPKTVFAILDQRA